MFVLGIDAGGTKTVCLLADGEGTVLARRADPARTCRRKASSRSRRCSTRSWRARWPTSAIAPAAICLGIAGVDRPDDAPIMRGIMRRIGYKSPRLIVNDALVALTAGAGDGPGIVVICGTGSICYGRNEQGQAARTGGWGYHPGRRGQWLLDRRDALRR